MIETLIRTTHQNAMTKRTSNMADEVLPKINVPLPERGREKMRTDNLSYTRPHYRKTKNPADLYAYEIMNAAGISPTVTLNEKQYDTSSILILLKQFFHFRPMFAFSCAVVFVVLNGMFLFMFRPDLMAGQPNAEAELSFEPSRISDDFAKQMERESTAITPSTYDTNEEDMVIGNGERNIVDVPNRRVIVVNEEDRDQLLRSLKDALRHDSDTEDLDTYMNVNEY